MSTSKITPERQIHLIGLTGYAGTGKDTVRALLEKHGFHGFSFADPMRAMLRAKLETGGFDARFMERRELKEEAIPILGFSYRELMQTLGDWGRGLAPDFWLRHASAYVSDAVFCGVSVFCVSDVRFANEAAWVRHQGGVIWRVHRDAAQPVREHVSESGVDDITPDLTVHNNGTLGELDAAVRDALGVMA